MKRKIDILVMLAVVIGSIAFHVPSIAGPKAEWLSEVDNDRKVITMEARGYHVVKVECKKDPKARKYTLKPLIRLTFAKRNDKSVFQSFEGSVLGKGVTLADLKRFARVNSHHTRVLKRIILRAPGKYGQIQYLCSLRQRFRYLDGY